MTFTSVFSKSSFYIRRIKKYAIIHFVQSEQKSKLHFVQYSDLKILCTKCYTCVKQLRERLQSPCGAVKIEIAKKVLKRYWHKFKLVIQYIHHKKKLVIQSKKSCQTYLAVTINLNPWFWHRVFWTLKSEWWLTE